MATKKSSSIEEVKPTEPVGFIAKLKAEHARIVKRDGTDKGLHAEMEALINVLEAWYNEAKEGVK